MLNKVDLIEELQDLQTKYTTDELLVEVHDILLQETKRDRCLRARLSMAPGKKYISEGRLDPRRVFDLETIRKVAIRYRLRFLDTKFYRNEYPRQAISAIKHLEDGLGHDLSDFKILAPAKAFDLCDADTDPLLFVPVGSNRYYLVHKWGKDLRMYRRLLYWPIRKLSNLLLTMLVVSALLACLAPSSLLTSAPGACFFGLHRIMFFAWTSLVLASGVVYTWFAFFGKFSTKAWNDHHFN